jgi:putative nucleotidyltransferase with HDIG domain
VVAHFNENLWYTPDSAQEHEAESRAAQSLAAKVGKIVGAKPFPASTQRLQELTSNPNSSLDPAIRVIESDPGLSTRLLRLVNSSAFALRTPCTSVAHAASLVGMKRLHQLAQTATILELVDAKSDVAALILEHSTVVAALSRYLAGHVGLPPEELFTCGLLHDIGKVILLESESDLYRTLVETTITEPDSAHIRERDLLGYDHAVLGGHVLAAWNIPSPIPKVVAWHHQVARAYDEDPSLARTINTLRLADATASALFRPVPEQELAHLARSEAASYLDISEAQLAAMWDELLALALRARASCRGEAMPEVEPERPEQGVARRNSLYASLDEPHQAPCNFPCVACGVPTYANVCRACNGYVCPAHQQNADEWCSLCEQRFASLTINVAPWAYALVGGAIGAMLVGTLVGLSGAVTGAPLRLMVAPGLVALFVVVVLGVWHRWLRRLWFVRTTPNRRSMAPPVGRRRSQRSLQLKPSGGFTVPLPSIKAPSMGPVVREVESSQPNQQPVLISERPRRGERAVSLRPSIQVQSAAAERNPFERLTRPNSASVAPEPKRPSNGTHSTPAAQSARLKSLPPIFSMAPAPASRLPAPASRLPAPISKQSVSPSRLPIPASKSPGSGSSSVPISRNSLAAALRASHPPPSLDDFDDV